MTPEQQSIQDQLDQIKAMLHKNLKMLCDYLSAPDDNKPITKEQHISLVRRSEMLMRCLKDVENQDNSETGK